MREKLSSKSFNKEVSYGHHNYFRLAPNLKCQFGISSLAIYYLSFTNV